MSIPALPRCFFLFVLCAVLLRAVLPAGYMPQTGHAFKMVICTERGAQEVAVKGDFDPFRKPVHKSGKPCEFSLVTLDAPLAGSVVMDDVQGQKNISYIFSQYDLLRFARLKGQTQSRAPPALV